MKLIVLIAIVFISNCKRQEPPIPSHPPYKSFSALELVWRTKLSDSINTKVFDIFPTKNSEGDIFFSSNYYLKNEHSFILIDGKTGVLKWEVFPFLGSNENPFFSQKPYLLNDVLVFHTQNYIYSLSTVTGQILWKQSTSIMNGTYDIFHDNDKYIYFATEIKKPGIIENEIYRTKYNDLNWELVTKIIDSSNYYNAGNTLTFTHNMKEESLLILEKDLEVNYKNVLSRFYCYNITLGKMQWVTELKDKVIQFENSYPGKIECNNQNVIFTWLNYNFSVSAVCALKLEDGSLAWENIDSISGFNFDFNFFIYNKNNIIRNDAVKSLNSLTGSENWISKYNYNEYTKIIFKNYLFSTGRSYLSVYDLNNGNQVFNNSVSLPGWSIQGKVAISEDNRLLYFKDELYLNCFKLPSEIIY
ncbi:MAG: hypothetical protein ACOYMA_13655 [Bacteroidia bacterium]